MSTAVLQVLAALVTASVGALATLAALSPTGARLKRLERLLALREVGRGSAAEPKLEMAIRRASEEVVIDGEVGRSASGWRNRLIADEGVVIGVAPMM